MKQLRVERQKGYYGMFRVLKIVIDGEVVAELKQEQSITIDVDNDAKEIWGKMDWARTERMKIDNIPASKVLVFKAYFTLNPFRNIGLLPMPFKIFFKA